MGNRDWEMDIGLCSTESSVRITLEDSSGEEGAVYLAGNFNGWKPADARYVMKPEGQSRYFIDLPMHLIPAGRLDYKYTRGDWSSVELNTAGKHSKNRHWTPGMEFPQDAVFHWQKDEDLGHIHYQPIIRDLSDQFHLPEVIRTRRISLLLPWDYEQSGEHYPLVFLQDGQNLFQDKAPYGNWHIDRKLARLAARKGRGLILVAVDHTHEHRFAEYMPPEIPDQAEAHGRAYISFLQQEVKPWVCKHFRTLDGPENTIIGGSSMGGLISLYAHMAYPNIFGKALILSPSLWLIPNMLEWLLSIHRPNPAGKVYLYAGGRESAKLEQELIHLYHTLGKICPEKEMLLKLDSRGEHHEFFWGEEFYQSLDFLLK